VDVARVRLDDGHGGASVVDEALLAGPVGQTQARLEPPRPPGVVVAELRVAEPVGVALAVLEPQKLESDALLAKLRVDHRPVRHRPQDSVGAMGIGEEKPVERLVPQVCWKGPGQPGVPGAAEVLADRTVANAAATNDRLVGQAALPLQAQDFSDLTHGQPLPGHLHLLGLREGGECRDERRLSSVDFAFRPRYLKRIPDQSDRRLRKLTADSGLRRKAVGLPSKRAVGIRRNPWSDGTGFGRRNDPARAAFSRLVLPT